ncbi:hypothetical protein [Mucilaginibacter sp. L196]|uniref:hypothetical protein n=1 Tax=Mucilaginibacter sp. L196 TaxID=1641870 RepID=UPI00131DE0A7|nr:hypothetical protein [Mucilaginibacter sp. L196]
MFKELNIVESCERSATDDDCRQYLSEIKLSAQHFYNLIVENGLLTTGQNHASSEAVAEKMITLLAKNKMLTGNKRSN